ncbi:hypothetical protein LX16_3820 [Stackebrandtia albiflava]|uniref:Uncharacterized protein n=1 Tax=Stackebrandtia albiflava TaxID=406432 RepID=A0A562V5H5_9ACTN|nr:hypothetical protein [Stackebrandtia albiflava]TWJ13052.1 hypothetical protein LX16_3820 [Stackebrandtia albiflava]
MRRNDALLRPWPRTRIFVTTAALALLTGFLLADARYDATGTADRLPEVVAPEGWLEPLPDDRSVVTEEQGRALETVAAAEPEVTVVPLLVDVVATAALLPAGEYTIRVVCVFVDTDDEETSGEGQIEVRGDDGRRHQVPFSCPQTGRDTGVTVVSDGGAISVSAYLRSLVVGGDGTLPSTDGNPQMAVGVHFVPE